MFQKLLNNNEQSVKWFKVSRVSKHEILNFNANEWILMSESTLLSKGGLISEKSSL